eukprot:945818-Rhodomonas_salina.3
MGSRLKAPRIQKTYINNMQTCEMLTDKFTRKKNKRKTLVPITFNNPEYLLWTSNTSYITNPRLLLRAARLNVHHTAPPLPARAQQTLRCCAKLESCPYGKTVAAKNMLCKAAVRFADPNPLLRESCAWGGLQKSPCVGYALLSSSSSALSRRAKTFCDSACTSKVSTPPPPPLANCASFRVCSRSVNAELSPAYSARLLQFHRFTDRPTSCNVSANARDPLAEKCRPSELNSTAASGPALLSARVCTSRKTMSTPRSCCALTAASSFWLTSSHACSADASSVSEKRSRRGRRMTVASNG